jgi:hypothetical protein
MTKKTSMKLAKSGIECVMTAIMWVMAGIFWQNFSILVHVTMQLMARILVNLLKMLQKYVAGTPLHTGESKTPGARTCKRVSSGRDTMKTTGEKHAFNQSNKLEHGYKLRGVTGEDARHVNIIGYRELDVAGENNGAKTCDVSEDKHANNVTSNACPHTILTAQQRRLRTTAAQRRAAVLKQLKQLMQRHSTR